MSMNIYRAQIFQVLNRYFTPHKVTVSSLLKGFTPWIPSFLSLWNSCLGTFSSTKMDGTHIPRICPTSYTRHLHRPRWRGADLSIYGSFIITCTDNTPIIATSQPPQSPRLEEEDAAVGGAEPPKAVENAESSAQSFTDAPWGDMIGDIDPELFFGDILPLGLLN